MRKPHDLMFLEMYHVALFLSNERAEMGEIPNLMLEIFA